MRHADWLIFQVTSKFVAQQVLSLMKNEQQSQNLLPKVDPHPTFRNNFLQLATNVFVAGQVDHALTKPCNETMLRDKFRVFVSCIFATLKHKGSIFKFFQFEKHFQNYKLLFHDRLVWTVHVHPTVFQNFSGGIVWTGPH